MIGETKYEQDITWFFNGFSGNIKEAMVNILADFGFDAIVNPETGSVKGIYYSQNDLEEARAEITEICELSREMLEPVLDL